MTTTALEIAQQALRDILDPIGYMERGLEEGYRLDGHAALQQMNTREFYVRLAREALAASEAAAPAQQACVCGEPTTRGVTHRQDGPCHVTEAPSLTVGERAAPTIPSGIIQLVSAYGDSRADGVLAGDALGAVIKALRAWGAGLAQPAAQAEPVAEHLPTKEHIRELAQEALDQIMEQAQVFASAWALIGGRFDDGNAPGDAEDAKSELRTMVSSLADLAAETVRPIQASNQPAQGVEDARDAARWRAVANVFHITDQVGERTGQHAVKLSTHWAAWVDGKHASVTDAVDAYAAAMAAEKEQQ